MVSTNWDQKVSEGSYQARKIVDPILSLQITSDKIIKFPKLVLDIERIPDIPIEKVERSISFSEEFFRQFIENNLWLSSIYHPIYSNYTRNCINSIHLLTNHLTHFWMVKLTCKKQNSSCYNIVSNHFNVNFAQYNLLRKYSRFKKIGTRASITFIESSCSSALRDFMLAAYKLDI